jgi:lysophosphatidylcholine acyltransferase/lyso-PAF acetyltransferase
MGYCFACTGIAFFLVWAIFITLKVNYWFSKKFKYLLTENCKSHPLYPALVRNDFEKWNKTEMIIGGIFLLPVRCLLFFVSLFTGWVCLKVLILVYGVKDLTCEQPAAFIHWSKKVIRLTSRFTLLMTGFYNIPVIVKKYKDVYSKLEFSKTSQTSIIISNHVSYMDIIYYLSRSETPGFIAREETSQLPFIGTFARILQCLFLDRKSRDTRLDVLNSLKTRVEKIKGGLNYNNILIFPEGTTTNGRCIINFKKGAFVTETPLKIVSLRYDSKFSPSFNMIDMIDSLLALLMQFSNSLKIIEIEGVVGPKKGVKWEEFAEDVRDMMCEELGFEKRDGAFEQKKVFESIVIGDS